MNDIKILQEFSKGYVREPKKILLVEFMKLMKFYYEYSKLFESLMACVTDDLIFSSFNIHLQDEVAFVRCLSSNPILESHKDIVVILAQKFLFEIK